MAQTEKVQANIRADSIKSAGFKRRKFQRFLVKTLVCILIALLFLVAVFEPGFGKVLACLGVVVCCSLAAVFVDRHFWR